MKVSFIHTGDLHLGRQFHFRYNGDVFGVQKRTDLWKTFEKILQIADQNAIDLLLIAGDFFDSDEADISEIHRAADRLGQLKGTKVVIIAGNHDYYSPASVYDMVEWPENVVILQSGKMESVYFQSLETEVYGLSWQKDTYHQMPYKGHMNLEEDRINILMLHGEAYKKQSDYMPIDIKQFDNFDYIALGHYHKPAFLNEKTAYCGSPEALNFGEENRHGVIVGQINEHQCKAQFLSLQERAYITEKIEIESDMSMDQVINLILEKTEAEGRINNYYRIILHGFCDIELDLDWLYAELRPYFYYLEIDDSDLEPDLDIEALLDDNANNIVGAFIREMRKDKENSIAKKALMIGLRGLLKEGLAFHDN